MPKPSDASAPFEMHLTIQWSKPNPIEGRAAKKLDFGFIPEDPGVYRIHSQMPDRPPRVYVGESENLRTRMNDYSTVRKTAAGPVYANRGINRRLRNVLSHAGKAEVLVATEAKVSVGGGRTRRLLMTKKFHRLLAENAAIVYQLMYTKNKVINAARPDVELK